MFASSRNPLRTLLATATSSPRQQCIRCVHSGKSSPYVPPPTPFVPDSDTFLKLIGRQMSKHSSKIENWKNLFTLSSPELRDLGVEPARTRRYLLRWREKFRRGEYGVGGDLKYVEDGRAELRIVEVPYSALPGATNTPQAAHNVDGVYGASATKNPGTKKIIMNLPVGTTTPSPEEIKAWKKLDKFKIHNSATIKGPYVKPLAGTLSTAGTLSVEEGMWEFKRGHKVDGGERRRDEVRAKRRAAARKAGLA